MTRTNREVGGTILSQRLKSLNPNYQKGLKPSPFGLGAAPALPSQAWREGMKILGVSGLGLLGRFIWGWGSPEFEEPRSIFLQWYVTNDRRGANH